MQLNHIISSKVKSASLCPFWEGAAKCMAHFFKLNRESVSDLPMKGKIPFGYRTNLDSGLIFLLNIFSLADRSPIHGSI